MKNTKEKLFEMMGKIDPSFKLNENAQDYKVQQNEIFGWSQKEKDAKSLEQKKEQAKQEVQNYNFNRIYFQPGVNADARNIKQSKEVRINGIKQELPLLAELMPELFDLNQGITSAIIKSGGKEHRGMLPLNWSFIKDSSGYVNQEKAVQELVKRIDALN